MACTPGETVRVACAASEGLGECSGDPVLELCDGDDATCATSRAIAQNDDASPETRCPAVEVECPSSGSVLVTSRAFADGAGFACDWAVSGASPNLDGSVDAPDTGAPDTGAPDGAPPMPDGAPPMDARPPMPDGAPLDSGPRPDGGTCELPTSPGPRCCYEDSDCGDTPGGTPQRCVGATCTSEGEGFCVPEAPPGGVMCFVDSDCSGSQTCNGAFLGCASSCMDTCTMAMRGTCSGS